MLYVGVLYIHLLLIDWQCAHVLRVHCTYTAQINTYVYIYLYSYFFCAVYRAMSHNWSELIGISVRQAGTRFFLGAPLGSLYSKVEVSLWRADLDKTSGKKPQWVRPRSDIFITSALNRWAFQSKSNPMFLVWSNAQKRTGNQMQNQVSCR